MNFAKIKPLDVANGPGVRVSIFVSGCEHACPGCFNREAWDFSFGESFSQETIDTIIAMLDKPHIKGLSLLGGEPFHSRNQAGLRDLVSQVRTKLPLKDIWCFTGYTVEEIIDESIPGSLESAALLQDIDILVDGKFDQSLKDLTLKFRGSSNQRLIDAKESLSRQVPVIASL